jgi:hypothetical protein
MEINELGTGEHGNEITLITPCLRPVSCPPAPFTAARRRISSSLITSSGPAMQRSVGASYRRWLQSPSQRNSGLGLPSRLQSTAALLFNPTPLLGIHRSYFETFACPTNCWFQPPTRWSGGGTAAPLGVEKQKLINPPSRVESGYVETHPLP